MDLDILFNKVQQHYVEQLPFVIYRKPGKDLLRGVFQKSDHLFLSSSYSESAFVFAPFDTNLNSIIFPLEKCDLLSASYMQKSQKNFSANNVTDLTPENQILKETHIKLIEKGLEYINETDLKKVVLSRRQDVKVKEITSAKVLLDLFEKLVNTYPSAFVYCWFHPAVGLWMGATPETLFSLENKTFRTMSLAATQKADNSDKILWSEKEKEEQLMVTNFLESTLERVVPILMISKPTTYNAGSILHLKTDIGGTINTRVCDIPCLIKKLHPTPAVCGLPKDLALNFITKNEGYDREFYSGFLGELNYNDAVFENKENVKTSYADLYVNLRCMKIHKEIATLFVGGGITANSDTLQEWNETVNKTETMMQILS